MSADATAQEVCPGMGAGNVMRAYVSWAHLPANAFRILVFMAVITLDDAVDPKYWGGREPLVRAIGREPLPEPAASDKSARANDLRKARAADFQAVKIAIGALVKAGVVTQESPGAPGRNAVYALRFDAPTGKAEPTEQGRLSLGTGYAEPTEWGRPSLPPRSKNLPTGGSGATKSIKTTGPNTARVVLSPETEYEKAMKLLALLPDLGSEYISRVPPDVTGLTERVIAAAHLARQENTG